MKMGGVVLCLNLMLCCLIWGHQGVITPYPLQLIYTFFAYEELTTFYSYLKNVHKFMLNECGNRNAKRLKWVTNTYYGRII